MQSTASEILLADLLKINLQKFHLFELENK